MTDLQERTKDPIKSRRLKKTSLSRELKDVQGLGDDPCREHSREKEQVCEGLMRKTAKYI
jgi:hypothetical protein